MNAISNQKDYRQENTLMYIKQIPRLRINKLAHFNVVISQKVMHLDVLKMSKANRLSYRNDIVF